MVKARQLFKTMLFSAVIVDARLPEDISLVRPKMQASGGMTLIREFKQHSPHLGVVLFTAHDDFGGEFSDLLRAGMRGIAYVLKGRSISHLMRHGVAQKDVKNTTVAWLMLRGSAAQ